MWRLHTIAALPKRYLIVPQRISCINGLFYSTSKRKPSDKSGNYEISGIYSGVHSSTPHTPFLKALRNVRTGEKRGEGRERGGREDRRGDRRDGRGDRREKREHSGRDRNGVENEGEEASEGQTNRAGWERRERRHKQGNKAKTKGKENQESGQLKKNKIKKRKVEPFVIYKAPAKVEDDRGQFENTMFVKKVKPRTVRGKSEEGAEKVEEEKTAGREKTEQDAKDVKAEGEKVGKVEKQPKFINSMFKRQEPEQLEEEEVVDSATEDGEEGDEDIEIAKQVKEQIRKLGEGQVEKRDGDLFTHRVVQQTEDGMRMDRWAGIHFPTLPHSKLCKFLRNKLISFSAPPDTQRKKATIDTRLHAGNVVHVYTKLGIETKVEKAPLLRLTDKELEVIRSWVIHKDEHILVINKPEGLPVQGGTKVGRHLAQLLHSLRGEKEEDPRLVHRLDRDTSGVLVLARTRQAATKLTEMFKENKVTKIYWALLAGIPNPPIGRINMPLEKVAGPRGEERMVPREKVTKTAKSASTDYNTVEEFSTSCSFVVLAPSTGRTHQLRVHCAAALGAHIVGDQKYGDGKEISVLEEVLEEPPTKLHLHARRIVFIHPFTKARVNVAAKLPEHMLQSWKSLGMNPNYKEKLSEIAQNPDKPPDPVKKPEKTYGSKGNVRRSIWNPKVSKTPIRDMKMRSALVKHNKKMKKRKANTKSKGDKKEEEKKEMGGKRRTRAAISKEQKYRAMRRSRPVRKLAPKIKR